MCWSSPSLIVAGGVLSDRRGRKPMFLLGVVLFGLGSVGLPLVGLGAGLALTPMTATAVGAVRPERAGMASAVHNSMRQIGQVLGVAVLGALVYAGLGRSAPSGQRLDAASEGAYDDGLHHAMWVSGLALLAAAVLVAVLVPPQPREP